MLSRLLHQPRTLLFWACLGCHGAHPGTSHVKTTASVPPPVPREHAARPSAPKVRHFRVPLEGVSEGRPRETLLRSATIAHGGERRHAALSLVRDAVGPASQPSGVLILRMDKQVTEIAVGPAIFLAAGLDVRLRFHVIEDDLYLEIQTLEPDPDWDKDLLRVLLYRVEKNDSPVKVLEEYVQVERTRCARDEVKLRPLAKGSGRLRLEVHRRAVKRDVSVSSKSCSAFRPTVRRQVYELHEGCYQPQMRPFYFAPELARYEIAVPGCATSLCIPEVPRAAAARSLLKDLKGESIIVPVPVSWKPVGPSTVLEIAPSCRASFSMQRLPTLSKFARTHAPREIDRVVKAWISACCAHAAGCMGPAPPSPQTPYSQVPCLASLEVDSEWRACGDLYRARASAETLRLDAIAIRIPQADGSSIALLVTLACESHWYASAVTEIELSAWMVMTMSSQ